MSVDALLTDIITTDLLKDEHFAAFFPLHDVQSISGLRLRSIAIDDYSVQLMEDPGK